MKPNIETIDFKYSKLMSLDEYVESRLKRWAMWVLSKDNPGLNYSKKSLIYRMMNEAYVSLKYQSNKSSPSDPLADEIEEIINAMFKESLTFQRCAIALREDYLSRKKHQHDRAAAVNMSVTRFKIHVERARMYLAGVLKERYVFNFENKD